MYNLYLLLLHLLDFANAIEYIDKSIEKQFFTKGDEVVNANKNAIRQALDKVLNSNGNDVNMRKSARFTAETVLSINNYKDKLISFIFEDVVE